MLLIIFAGVLLPGPAQAAPAGSRVPWQGGNWYLQGANVPWYNWGCDFGCGANGGVSSPAVQSALVGPFGQLQAAGAHVVRWWAFEGNAWQIAQDGSGAPTGVNPAVYADFDAALALAQQYDLYYDFVLFSAPTAIPTAWETDPAQRQALANALAPLFARYKGNPRILSWEVFNEPELDIWGGKIAQSAVQATVQAIAASVHANSTAYVTVGSAMLDGLPLWEGLGLDYYQAHWYDYMSSGNYCARCTDYSTVRARYNLDAPLVIGETYAGPDTDAYQRFADFYNKGYAGYWPWSLFPSHTSDGMSIDLGAMRTFDGQHSDIGPTSGGGSASTTTSASSASSTSSAATTATTSTATTSTATTPQTTSTTSSTATSSTATSSTASGAPVAGTPTFQISATVSPATAAPGAPVTITANVQDLTGALSDGVVAIDVMDAAGRQLLSQPATGQNLTAGQSQTYSATWTAPSTPGTYTILVAVFGAGWSPRYALNANAATLTVATDASSTTTASTTSAATTSASTTSTTQDATSTSASATSTTDSTSATSATSTSATTSATSTSSAATSTDGAGTPSFNLSADLPAQTVTAGTPVTITANVQDLGGALTNGVVEVEVMDAAGNRPFNQYVTGQDFAAGQARSYQYTWTPSASGTYTVMIVVYGSGWSQRYALDRNAGTITVR